MPLAEFVADLRAAGTPNALISDLREVVNLEQLCDKLTTTVMPSGETVRMQPLAVDREDAQTRLHFPYGEDTRTVLAEAGFASGEIEDGKASRPV